MIPSLGLRGIASWPPLRDPGAGLPGIVADVPSLQRGLVWRPGQIELLWDSLMRGFPVGSLVIRKKLAAELQASRHAQDEGRTTHHLLDGQQRAQAIKLGFEDPFDGRPTGARQILWLDLTPANLGETRAFLFRVTTGAHPWGYLPTDAAGPVGVARIRDSLRMCGSPVDDQGFHVRPKPWDCWPIAARTPVPFAWLAGPHGGAGEGAFWAGVRAHCEALRGRPPHEKWAADAVNLLNSPPDTPALRAVWSGLERVRAAEVPLLELPGDAISSATAREEADPGRENVTNLENLFHRLNRGGTLLDGDDLAYSMIKAHWHGLDRTIAELAETRRLPEARLVTVAARLPFGEERGGQGTGHPVSSAINVSRIRKLAQAGCRAGGAYERFKRFFDGDDVRGLPRLLEQIHRWCDPAADHGLPLVLQTAIARGSPDVYALLLWMADRALDVGGDDGAELGRTVQGLVTALHWFALDKRGAAGAVAARLEEAGPLSREGFSGILAHAINRNGAALVRLPLSVARLEAALGRPREDSNRWGCWTTARENDRSADRQAVQAAEIVIHNTDMLLYAQRAFIKSRFASYDPAMEETWAQHNRPWDFDHIVPKAAIDYVPFRNKDTVKEWALRSVANLRAWPMEDNRSDQRVPPGTKIDGHKRLSRQEVLDFSFLNEDELGGFDEGFNYTLEEESPIGALEAYVDASRSRLVRIYRAWYDPAGLDISHLIGGDRALPPS